MGQRAQECWPPHCSFHCNGTPPTFYTSHRVFMVILEIARLTVFAAFILLVCKRFVTDVEETISNDIRNRTLNSWHNSSLKKGAKRKPRKRGSEKAGRNPSASFCCGLRFKNSNWFTEREIIWYGRLPSGCGFMWWAEWLVLFNKYTGLFGVYLRLLSVNLRWQKILNQRNWLSCLFLFLGGVPKHFVRLFVVAFLGFVVQQRYSSLKR